MNWSAALVALVPPGVVTVTSTVPEPAGEVAVMLVALLTVKLAAAVVANLTALAPVKPVPLIATEVLPVVGPEAGLRPVTAGAGMYVYWSAALVALVPPGVVTVTSTVPVPAGEVAVMPVALLTVKLAAAVAPKLTALAPVKPVPVIATEVPFGPELGLTPETVGAGGGEAVVIQTFWTSWMSVRPPVAPVKPTSTEAGRLVVA